MTDNPIHCVRGCRRPCREDECLADPAGCNHDTRIRATVGYLCDRCSEQLEQAVRDLPDLWANLPGLYDTGPGDQFGEKVTRGKVTGSPSLIRLDVMVLAASSFDEPGATPAYEGDGVMPVWPTLGGWVRLVEEELGLTAEGDTMTQVSAFLIKHHRQIASQPWADEYWSDLVAIWRALRRATRAPGPLGRCWGRIANRPDGGCGRLLYPPPPGRSEIVCPNVHCGRVYRGADLIKMAIQSERDQGGSAGDGDTRRTARADSPGALRGHRIRRRGTSAIRRRGMPDGA